MITTNRIDDDLKKEREDDEIEAFAEFLRHILENMGPPPAATPQNEST